MNKFLILLLTFLSILSCTSPKSETASLYDLIPEKSSFIIESNNMGSLLKNVTNNAFLKETDLITNLYLKEINKYISLSSPTKQVLYFIEKDSSHLDYVLLTKPENDSIIKTSEDFSVESIKTKDFSYKKTSVGNSSFFSAQKNEVLFTSNSLKLLQESINKETSEIFHSENFKKVIAARSIEKSSLFIHHKNSKNSIADWSVVDLDINSSNVRFNGIALTKEQPNQLLHIFQGVEHQKQEISKIIPNSAAGFYSFTYNDFSTISKNLQNYRKDSTQVLNSSFLNYTKEAGVIFLGNETAVALTLIDKDLRLENFPISDELKSEFRGVQIYTASKVAILKPFEPLLSSENLNFYMLLDNFQIYAEKQETLERIISNFQNNSTLFKNATFQGIQENIADASSLLIVTKPELSKAQIASSIVLNNASLFLEKNYLLAATQFVSNDNFTHIHGIVIDKSKAQNEEVEELITTTLPIKTTGKIYVINNSNKLTFAHLAENNSLSYLSEDGKVLWEKKFATQIIGDVQQVNLSSKTNSYMAFATLNKFHLLDSNGKYAKGFPIDFKDDITQALAVFDYDNNKNYRFVIVQGKELLMYNSKAEIVDGFDFKKATSEITQPPKHIRLKNKDYIVFPEKNGKLNILSRQGEHRIKLKEKFQFSENLWYENKNNFISISEDGKLIRIDEHGKVTKQELKAPGTIQVAANEKVLVFLSENSLSINNKELTLDFGLYTRPRIFTVSGKTYVSITDTQAKKVYLFNEKGELASNFPVYGSSVLSITTSKIRNRVSLFVLGESNEIISYQF